MTLSEKLKQARLEAGLSQRQLCGDTITRNMLSQIENGSARPSMDTLSYLASRLGKTVSYFLEEQAVVSPNMDIMSRARTHLAAGEWAACLRELERYSAPDAVYDGECALLQNMSLLELAEQAILEERLPYALQLLEQVKTDGIYYPAILRKHQLLLVKTGQMAALPELDDELLVRAGLALKTQDYDRCSDLLQAAAQKETAQWCLLKGEALFGKQRYEEAAECYRKAEQAEPQKVYSRLENCYRELGDYKLAYEYACKQR